ncbi:MAG: class I SAM-dependent methyltransferase [Bacteroidota bacterium]
MGLKYKIDAQLDSPERTIIHKQIIRNKIFLKKLYLEWYAEFKRETGKLPEGILLELGSGGGFLKEVIPSVICSDVIPLASNDLTFSALNMPFESNSVSGIFMIDTFHHIPDAAKFLHEAKRILINNGQIIMIEPANSLQGRVFYKNFHHEPFDPKGDWTIPSTGPLSGANGALPWIVFERDIKIFTDTFPELKISRIKYHTPFRYILSGGVSFRQVVPDFLFGAYTLSDKILSALSKHFSMFVTIQIIKVK